VLSKSSVCARRAKTRVYSRAPTPQPESSNPKQDDPNAEMEEKRGEGEQWEVVYALREMQAVRAAADKARCRSS